MRRIISSKSFFVIIGCFVFLFILLGLNCSQANAEETSGKTGITTIRYLTFETNTDQQRMIKELVKEFEKRNPDIKVKVEGNSNADRIYKNDAAAGIPPDVVYLMPDAMPGLIDNDVLEPLDSYIERDKIDLSIYYKQVVDNLRYPNDTGKLYAFPIHFSTDALFYNEEIFDEAGIPYPDETWDWNKYREIAGKLTSPRDKNGHRKYFGCLQVETQLLLAGSDAPIFDRNTNRFIVNNTTAVEIMRWNSEINGTAGPDISERADSDDMTLFSNKRLAMFIGRTWQLPEIDRRVLGKFRWNVTHVPKGSVKRFTMLGVGGNAISHMSKNKEAAWRFAKFYSSKDGLPFISKGRKNCVPAIKELANSPDCFLSPPPENVKVFIDAVEYAGVVVPIASWSLEVSSNVWLPYQNSMKSQLDGWTPEMCMKMLEEDSNAIIAKRELIDSRKKANAEEAAEKAQTGASTGFIFTGLIMLMAVVFIGIACLCRKDKRKWEGFAFISPWIIGFCLFTLGPIFASLYLSFCEYDIFSAPRWIGFENFQTLSQDRLYLISLKNTIYFTILVVPLSIIFSLALAVLINTKLPGAYTFRAIFYLPALTSGVAIALLWRWIFNPKLGLLNTILNAIGLQGCGWLTDPNWAMEAIVIMSVWGGLGGMMLIFLAGLQGIPSHLYEAADIDGATPWQKFWHVTRPMLSPTIFFNLIMSIISSFQVFATVFVMTSANGIDREPGGPASSTLVYVLYLYQTGFKNLYMGEACAMAWILFLIILALTGVNAWFSKHWVHYDQS
ncbi:MAG: extracellular solute-binding protein [Candidatus Sumerlaeales bacterium]|nr:extracellular solute-binding protein [Candidatus Sumerlaeales bacterium]